MLIELKNIPLYGKGLEIEGLGWSTIDTFENIDIKLTPFSDKDSTEEFWVIRIETKNGKAAFRAATQEKQKALYEFVKAALLTEQKFLSVDFEEWK